MQRGDTLDISAELLMHVTTARFKKKKKLKKKKKK